MNGLELENLLKEYPVRVCCADELPTTVRKRPGTFVANTDPCDRRGRHWVVFHFPKTGPPEFFDSLGETPETYHERFRNVLIANGPRYLYTPDRIQPDDSDTCGLYCIHFVRERYRGICFEGVLKDFSTRRLKENESKVIKFIRVENAKRLKKSWTEKTARTASVGS